MAPLSDCPQSLAGNVRDYNGVSPHSAIGNKPPKTLMNTSGACDPPQVSPPRNSPAEWSKNGYCETSYERRRSIARCCPTSALSDCSVCFVILERTASRSGVIKSSRCAFITKFQRGSNFFQPAA